MHSIQWLIPPMYLVTKGIIFHKSESMRCLHISKFNVGSLLKYTTWSKCLWKVNRICHPWNHFVIMKCILTLENVASNVCSKSMENPRILLSVFLKTEWSSLSMNGRITAILLRYKVFFHYKCITFYQVLNIGQFTNIYIVHANISSFVQTVVFIRNFV